MRNIQLATASSLLLCALASCADQTASSDELARRRHATSPDAAVTPLAASGSVSCYTEGSPDNSCALPTHCCFNNFTAQHDGACSDDPCAYGTIDCDGPEDCAAGERCISHALSDPDWGLIGYSLACRANPIDANDKELCHPDGPPCANGGTCVTALGNANDIPRSLYICK